jgi:hypothetical protein
MAAASSFQSYNFFKQGPNCDSLCTITSEYGFEVIRKGHKFKHINYTLLSAFKNTTKETEPKVCTTMAVSTLLQGSKGSPSSEETRSQYNTAIRKDISDIKTVTASIDIRTGTSRTNALSLK